MANERNGRKGETEERERLGKKRPRKGERKAGKRKA